MASDLAAPVLEVTSATAKVWFTAHFHGRLRPLQVFRELSRFDVRNDHLIHCGNLIDRGPHSLPLVQVLREPWFHGLAGVHEVRARDALAGSLDALVAWEDDGGLWAAFCSDEIREEIRGLLSPLPQQILVRCGDLHLHAHARGLVPNLPEGSAMVLGEQAFEGSQTSSPVVGLLHPNPACVVFREARTGECLLVMEGGCKLIRLPPMLPGRWPAAVTDR